MTRNTRIAGLVGLLLPLMVVAQEEAPSAAAPAQIEAEPELAAMVQITGVETLADYAAVGRLLAAIEGVRRVDVAEAAGATVIFRVLVRGGSAALDRGLEGSGGLVRTGPAAGRPTYEYRR